MQLLAHDLMYELVQRGDFTGILVLAGGMTVAVIAILAGTISSIFKTRAREATKRELAAYVAEGTLDPDHAVRIANAGSESDTDCRWGKGKSTPLGDRA